jgi:predicted flap endonuclease-1-like 5' DNA nuclease
LLAIAPGCDFHLFKMADDLQWAALPAFRMAVQAGARVISNSWAQIPEPVLEAEILAAIEAGITVVFGAGTGPAGWPGCMPGVLCVGGSYPRQDGAWEASNYAGSGTHARYPDRHCPDLTAIIGRGPRGILIRMPTSAGSVMDRVYGGAAFPSGDETVPDDGWVVASGSSGAAAMVAGAVALLVEARPGLAPAEAKQALAATCLDVVQGVSGSGEAAGPGRDHATGAGMLNVGAAVDRVAPLKPCPTAPFQCLRGPTCRIAPSTCYRAPMACARAPFVCARAPVIECLRTPVLAHSRPAPATHRGAQPQPGKDQPGSRPAEQPTAPDDLRKIEGIGPKIAGLLHGSGITTFARLAGASSDQLVHILARADPRLVNLVDPSTWPEQAALAAAGDWPALAALQGQLKAGRRE